MDNPSATVQGPIVSPLARWFMPSVADVLFLSVFITILFHGNNLLNDADTAWHIRTGDYILSKMEVPKEDIFSYRMYGQPWIAHEWLSDVVFAFLHRYTGLNGIVAFSAFTIAFTFFLLFKMLEGYRFDILAIVFVTVLAALNSSIHWFARPHIFSLCLTLIWYALLESNQRLPRIKHLLLFPLLMTFWVNLHGGYLLGFVLIFVYLIGNFMNHLITRRSDPQQHKKHIRYLSTAALLSFITSLINPYGYRILLFPLEVLGSNTAMRNISEWQSPSFHQLSYYEFYLLLLIVTILVFPRKWSFIEIGLFILSTHMSLVSARYIPIFGVLMAPILSRQLHELFLTATRYEFTFYTAESVRKRIIESTERIQALNVSLRHHLIPIVLSVFIIFVCFNGGYALGKKILDYQFDEKRYPLSAVEFLKSNQVTGNMYNSYVFGGYLIYSFFPDPRYRVFVDGRAIVGGDDYIETYLKVNQLTPQWREILENHQVNWIIEHTGSQLSELLLADKDWKLIYSDEVANIFVKNTSQNRVVIEKYTGVKPLVKEK